MPLTQAQPPAWASSLGESLQIMYNNNQILEQILKLAQQNAETESLAAQASGQAQHDLAENQSKATADQAYGQIGQGSVTIGGEIGNHAINNWRVSSQISDTESQITKIQAASDEIDDVEKNAAKTASATAANAEAGPGAQVTEAQIKAMKNFDGTQELDDATKQKIALAKTFPKEFEQMKENVSNKLKTLSNKLENLNSQKQQAISRTTNIIQAFGQAGAAGTASMLQSQTQAAGAAIQYGAQIASFFLDIMKSTQQLIMSQKDLMFNQMITAGDDLIGKLAQTNQMG